MHKHIKFNGATYKLANEPGSMPLVAYLKITRAPNFEGYDVVLEALEDADETNFTLLRRGSPLL